MVAKTLTGEEIEELKGLASAHFWPHYRQAGDVSEETGVRLLQEGNGVWVKDVNGKRWMDTLAGMWLKNIGHGRKEIAEAVYNQMLDISYTPGGSVSPATVKLVAKLASLVPDKESRVYLISGGSEAVETALKMAKHYHTNNGEYTRWKIISRRGSYHGATQACMSLGGGAAVAHSPSWGPMVPGNVHVATPNEYRCVYCSGRGGCNLECARDVGRAIEHEDPASVAAFIGEPVSASAGIQIPHPEYWPTIREICDKHGVLLIVDEVITGFGRTGKMFAVEHWDLKPDIITVAKALTSGYLPIGAAIASKRVADSFLGDDDKSFMHLFTFGGNPAASAAALANLAIIEKEGLVEKSAKMGEYLYQQLQTLYKHPIVGDVRGGKGLLAAVELVKDRDTKEYFPKDANLKGKVHKAMSDRGLMGRAQDVIWFSPPLCITKDEIDHLVSQYDQVLDEVEKQL